ncbi:MAG TPA: SAM-dependent methyltransferase [Gammaproteobacteria bacterium]|nr:SAM-dependent methyltransferase [Gammaproteobacteria bacterium]
MAVTPDSVAAAPLPPAHPPPLLTKRVHDALLAAARAGGGTVECSLDLGRTRVSVQVDAGGFAFEGRRFDFLARCKDHTVYHWTGSGFEPVARFTASLVKLVPTEWGPPTFEIDGIKMLPTARVSPYVDAQRKVELIRPQGKRILDTCGGLGYFAAWCLEGGAAHVASYEKSADVLWLRSLNPWSPPAEPRLTLVHADIANEIAALPSGSFDAALHDPPRFGIAGELYSGAFYRELSRVLRRGAVLFHYTGSPNRLTSGRDVANEVSERLRRSGFETRRSGDGVLATRT